MTQVEAPRDYSVLTPAVDKGTARLCECGAPTYESNGVDATNQKHECQS